MVNKPLLTCCTLPQQIVKKLGPNTAMPKLQDVNVVTDKTRALPCLTLMINMMQLPALTKKDVKPVNGKPASAESLHPARANWRAEPANCCPEPSLQVS